MVGAGAAVWICDPRSAISCRFGDKALAEQTRLRMAGGILIFRLLVLNSNIHVFRGLTCAGDLVKQPLMTSQAPQTDQRFLSHFPLVERSIERTFHATFYILSGTLTRLRIQTWEQCMECT